MMATESTAASILQPNDEFCFVVWIPHDKSCEKK